MSCHSDNKSNFIYFANIAREEFKSITQKHPELKELSHRELDIFLVLLSDKTQKQIAEELYVSVSTVHFHTKNIYKKLNVTGRKQLLIKYKDI